MRGWWAVAGWVAGFSALGCAGPAVTAAREADGSLVLLHTSDLHSRVWPFPERIAAFESELGLGPAGSLQEVGGFARLAWQVEEERRQGAQLWLDSGDALEGAPVFERFGGRVELELLSALGLSAMALGNHELSLPAAGLAEALGAATFPVLAANLAAEADSPLARLLVPSVVLEAGGLRVGVVGVANPTSPPALAEPGNRWALAQADITAATQVALDDLAPRVDLLIALTHLGLDGDHALVRATTGLDLVLGGHQHVVTREPEWQDDCQSAPALARGCAPRRVPIVHSGSYGKLLTRLELELRRSRHDVEGWQVSDLSLQQLPLTQATPERADVLERLALIAGEPEPPLAFLPEALPRRSALGGDSALGNLTTDAVGAATGAEVVLLNSSGLRADLEPGPLFRSDLALAFPFAEPWRVVWLTGRRLRQGLARAARRSAARRCETTLQVAGLELRIDCAACQRAPDCVAVQRVTPWGEVALADDALLSVCLPEYLLQPGGDFEGLLGAGQLVALSVVDALAAEVARKRATDDVSACVESLVGLSSGRCEQAFGVAACPLTAERARGWCRGLPVLTGERDGRIQAIP